MSTRLEDQESIENILKEMTVSDKAKLVIGGSLFRSECLEEFGIPSMYMLDSCNGLDEMEYSGEAVYQKLAADAEKKGVPLNREENGNMGGLLLAFKFLKEMSMQKKNEGHQGDSHSAGAYPPGISYGATWDPDIVNECSAAMADEMGSHGIDMVLGPNINIHRSPLCGRLAESISEDPFLTARIAAAQINGIQQEGLIACAKHFAANNQEKDRMGINEHISERALREIYLPAFKACVDAGVGSLMSAYNKINGKPSAMNQELLTNILRDEWGFDGFVVSDWGASYDQVKSIAAGTDLTMPGPRGIKCVEKAVSDGTLPVEKLDSCVRHFLSVLLKAPCVTGKYPKFDMQRSLRAAEKAARSAMILLKNDGTLPLPDDAKVVFYGKRSKAYTYCGSGSSKVISDLATNPFDRAAEIVGQANVTFEIPDPDTKYWIVTVGADGHEGSDRMTLSIDSDEQEELTKAISQAKAASGKVVVIVNATGPVDLSLYESDIDAILCPFFNGMQGGKAVADALFGFFNPSGKLPLTWPKRISDTPAFKNYPGECKEVWYGEGMYVGYRWYDARQISVAYPFGYGLSYTEFELDGLAVPESVNVDTDNLELRLKVKNTGRMAGSEVIQIYVHADNSRIDMPFKQLRSFQKVYLEPGEEKEVGFILKKHDFSCYSLELAKWITQPGKYELFIGNSSANLPLCATVRVCCKNPFGYGDKSGVGKIAGSISALAAVNETINGDLREIAHVAIEYAPDTPFVAIWNGEAMKRHFIKNGITEAQVEKLRAELQQKFDRIVT